MTDKIDKDMQDRLQAILADGISDDSMKAINKHVDRIRDDIEGDVMYRLKEELAPNLAAFAADMAQSAVESILEGNEDAMRRYLSCEKRGEDGQYIGWTGRSDPPSG